MTLILIYGNDSTGKSVQCKNICLASENALYISVEYAKNHRMLRDAEFEVMEVQVIRKDHIVDEVACMDAFGKAIEKVVSSDKYKVVVVDGISQIPRYAAAVVLKKLQEKEPLRKTIGEENLVAWAARNRLAALPIERLSSWAVTTSATVIMTSLMTDEYVGTKKVGRKVDAKDYIRSLCDVRVMLVHDGRGYITKFEKVPEWAEAAAIDVAMDKMGLLVEFGKRGLL